MCSCHCAEISQCSLTLHSPEPSKSPMSDAGSVLCSLYILCAHRSCSQVKVQISTSFQAPEGTGVFYSFLYPKHLIHNKCSVNLHWTEELGSQAVHSTCPEQGFSKGLLVANLRMWVILLGRILLPSDPEGRRLKNVPQIHPVSSLNKYGGFQSRLKRTTYVLGSRLILCCLVWSQ